MNERKKFLADWAALYLSVISSWEPQYYGDLPIPPESNDRAGWQGFWMVVEKQSVQGKQNL